MIKNSSPIQGKLKDKGIKIIFLGYARDHSKDVFRFFNPTTRRVVLSRDVTWLTKSTEEISIQVPKFGMLQLKSIKPDDKMDEIEFDKFNDSTVLEGKTMDRKYLFRKSKMKI